APFEAWTGSFSNGNIADGRAAFSWPDTSEDKIVGIRAAGNRVHISRRVIDISSPLAVLNISFSRFEQLQERCFSTSRPRIFSMPPFVKNEFSSDFRSGDEPGSELANPDAGHGKGNTPAEREVSTFPQMQMATFTENPELNQI